MFTRRIIFCYRITEHLIYPAVIAVQTLLSNWKKKLKRSSHNNINTKNDRKIKSQIIIRISCYSLEEEKKLFLKTTLHSFYNYRVKNS